MAYIRANKNKEGKIISYTAEIYMGRDAEGKKITEYITKQRRRDCVLAANKMELERDRKATSNIASKKVIDWFGEYIELNEGGKLADGTIKLYLGYQKRYFGPFFKQMRLNQVTDYHLKQFQSELLNKRGLAPSTTRRILLALSGAFAEALKDKSPFRDFEIVQANKPNVSAPSIEQLVVILKAIKGTRYEIPALMAAWCGFRRGEILALRENDFDFVRSTIRIDEAWEKNKYNKYVIGPPKSEHGYRTERAPEELMDMVKEMLAKRKVVELNSSKDNFIFNYKPDPFSNNFRVFLERRKIEVFTMHELRHFHSTWLYENDVLDHYAAKRMGNTIPVLKQTYQHLGLNTQKEQDEKILQVAKMTKAAMR